MANDVDVSFYISLCAFKMDIIERWRMKKGKMNFLWMSIKERRYMKKKRKMSFSFITVNRHDRMRIKFTTIVCY